jgi:hypothetical protein
MKADEKLRQLFDAERETKPPAGAADREWQRLLVALEQGAQSADIALGPLGLGLSQTSKWLIVGLLGTAAGTAVVGFSVSHESTELAAATQPAPAQSLEPAQTIAAPVTSPAEAPPAASATVIVPKASAGGSASAKPGFDEEIRLIELAKLDLDRGRWHLAEVWLSEHGQRFPRGVFAIEREALEVLLVCKRDGGDAGRRFAADFARRYPRSPLLDRVVRACEPKSNEADGGDK